MSTYSILESGTDEQQHQARDRRDETTEASQHSGPSRGHQRPHSKEDISHSGGESRILLHAE